MRNKTVLFLALFLIGVALVEYQLGIRQALRSGWRFVQLCGVRFAINQPPPGFGRYLSFKRAGIRKRAQVKPHGERSSRGVRGSEFMVGIAQR